MIQFSLAENEAERIVLLLSLKTSVFSRQGQHQNSSAPRNVEILSVYIKGRLLRDYNLSSFCHPLDWQGDLWAVPRKERSKWLDFHTSETVYGISVD